ncbi:MAG: hypothetical protein IJR35_00120 [Synergistaceae bacterium]|nr:hypothetical protein [Synergistaceae bacterium]MBR0203845.1 hypothetical protein [Synergistaceae bacterium]
MRKLFALILVLILASAACADIKLEMIRYKCIDCGKEFMGFRGDTSIDDSKTPNMKDPKYQLSHVFQLGNKDKNLPECSHGIKFHKFRKTGEVSYSISTLTNYLHAIAAVKDGGSLNAKLQEWECVLCKKHYYSLGNEELNIRDWEKQPEYIFNLKGKAIPKCEKLGGHLYGHVFEPTNSGSGRSYRIAELADRIYWVKQ